MQTSSGFMTAALVFNQKGCLFSTSRHITGLRGSAWVSVGQRFSNTPFFLKIRASIPYMRMVFIVLSISLVVVKFSTFFRVTSLEANLETCD